MTSDETTQEPAAPYEIVLVDIADKARREYGDRADWLTGRQLPEHEWRFVVTSAAGLSTFPVGATADQVAAALARDGVDVGRYGEDREEEWFKRDHEAATSAS
jgi:hypothetical protein